MQKTRRKAATRIVLKASIVFLATYVGLMTIVFFWGAEAIELPVNRWTARSSAWALRLLGAGATARGDLVDSSVASIRIISECTALYPAVIYVAAVVATPLPWRRKLWAALGLAVLAFVNLLRIVSLCYILKWYPGAADAAHYVVWQSLMIFVTVLLWILWAGRPGSAHDAAPA